MIGEGGEKRGAIALVSGGLDSTVALALALEGFRLERGVFFDYAQRAAGEEFRSAGRIARYYGIPLERIDLPWMGHFSRSALIRSGTADERRAGSPGRPALPAVWVENRNGIFVDIAASIAAATGCGAVIAGFNAEEAEDFPDNGESYLEAINRALAFGTSNGVEVVSPTVRMDKKEIVRAGIRLGIPWGDIWSCYRGGNAMCGRCGSCLLLKRAVEGTEASGLVHFEREQP